MIPTCTWDPRSSWIARSSRWQSRSPKGRGSFTLRWERSTRRILSVGKAIDPQSIGAAPAHIRVEQYVPQLSVLEQADLFITHGGMNSIGESVVYGVPMIVVPNTVEQAINAARVEQLGAGLYLDPSRLSAEDILSAVQQVLADPLMSEGLESIRRSFEDAGGVPRAADAIHKFKRANQLG